MKAFNYASKRDEIIAESINDALEKLRDKINKLRIKSDELWMLKPLSDTTAKERQEYLSISTKDRMEKSQEIENDIICYQGAIEEIQGVFYFRALKNKKQSQIKE